MRSIGKKNSNKVKALVRDAYQEGIFQYQEVFDYVKERLDAEVFDTWEGAYTEIQNIVMDEVMESADR